ncbi:MAG: hypothetical protein RL118_808 [Actinomycetota bacterium]|jgi:hypothetical protein
MTIRVAFVLFYVEAWDSLAATHELLTRDDRFEVLVVAVPKRLTGDAGFDDASDASEFLTAAGVEHETWGYADDGSQAARDLREWRPDYVFMNYPWQRNYQRELRPDALVRFTRIAYVPYFSLSLVKEPDGQGGFIQGLAPHYFTQRMHQLASLVFVQSADVRAAFAVTERGAAGVVAVGSPKLDALVASVDTSQRGPRVVFAPHHSYSPHWLNFGTFVQSKDALLAAARRHPHVEFVLRAHPFMWGTLIDREVMSAADLDAWRAEWDALPNTIDGADWSLAEVFDCDVMVSDGISFLAEYPLATGRRGLFIERDDHWPFTELGELAAAANVRIGLEELEARLESVLDELLAENAGEPLGVGAQSERSVLDLAQVAMPHPGQAANRIVEALLSHWAMKPGLVDAAAFSEVPWELQAGREPQD